MIKRILVMIAALALAGCATIPTGGYYGDISKLGTPGEIFGTVQVGEGLLVVTPGIRPQWGEVEKDDQKRIVTPYEAMKRGADYIVVGRPIRTATDPVEAAFMVVNEIERGLEDR